MRNRSKSIRRPANVVQFRGGRTKSPWVRPKRRWHGVLAIVAVGLTAGGLLGLGASKWLEGRLPTFSIATTATEGAPSLCIADVHDGDTIRTCDGERVRIENIDAPELPDSPKCTDRRRRGWCDYELAQDSRDELASFLAGGAVTISRSGTDKYGRTLATLTVNGTDAGDHLVSMGLARIWQ